MSEPMRSKTPELTTQILVFALVLFVFLYATSQLSAPYISHDDWDFLAPSSWGLAYSTPWDKTLTEGRWLSYLWYQASVLLTPKSSYLFFIVCYFFLACSVTWRTAKPRTFALCGLAIFFSPMLGQLSLWPTGMVCSVLLCGLASWIITRAEARFAIGVLFVATILLVLTYPPLAAVVLLTAALKTSDASIRGKVYIGTAYVSGFAAGSILIFILNFIFHDYFGVKVASWRNPRPLHDLTDLLANLTLYIQYWTELLHSYWLSIICGGFAALTLLYKETTRSKAISILLAIVLICGIELGITLVSGTAMPTRSAIWLWLSTCLLCALLAGEAPLFHRYAGSVLLAVLVFAGGTSWWNLYRQNQPAAEYQAHLAAWIQQYQAMTNISEVTVVGDPRRVHDLHSLWPQNAMPAFRMSMLKRYGIKINECSMEFCERIQRYLESNDIQPTPLLVLDGKLALVFDRNGTGGYYERNYPTAAEESALKLSYPLFLPYGADSVRITPFFPETSKSPVSVKLAPNNAGYTLRFEGTTCAFPVEYRLVGKSGERLATGEFQEPAAVELPQWTSIAGIGILSLRMAKGATNNYACNVVVTRR
ncbi:hypothetical protein ACVCL3_07750 [Rhodanobacter sp. UC4437_H4]